MKINISRLSDGEHFYTFIVKPSDLELEEKRFNKPVYVEAKLEKSKQKEELTKTPKRITLTFLV